MTEEGKKIEEEKITEEDKKAEEETKVEEEKKPEEEKKVDENEKVDKSKKAEESKKKSAEKPLDKMTVKELKEVAKEIPGIIGVHGMNKPDLLSEIKKSRGIEEAPKKKKDLSLLETKKRIKSLKVKREEARVSKDKKMVTVYRRKIAKLKKKTRRAA